MGVVGDIVVFVLSDVFDVIFIDWMLYMLDGFVWFEVLNKMLDYVVFGGWLFIVDEVFNMFVFKDVIVGYGG